MTSSLALLALLALTALAASAPAPGQSFSIKARSHRLSTEAAIALNKQRAEANPMLRSLLEEPLMHLQADAAGQATVNLTDYWQEILIGNITVGTPPQNFSVAFDFWGAADLYVIDSNTTLASYYTAKRQYNASASSTATNTTKPFRGYWSYKDTGYVFTDTVNIGGISNTISFGDLNQTGYWLGSVPADGVLGLSASNSTNGISNFLQQLVGSLASPVVTLHLNRTYGDWDDWPQTSDAEVMFGSRALPQCNAANWQTVALVSSRYGMYANVTSFSAPGVNDPCNTAVSQVSHPLVVVDYYNYLRVSVQAMGLFKKASGAVYNSTWGRFTVDCTQIDSFPIVNIGLADGSVIPLSGRDYVLDRSQAWYNACFLQVRGIYDDDDLSNSGYPLALGQLWLSRHCISYDISANTLSYTDALPNNGQ